jgi:hypothetical protein
MLLIGNIKSKGFLMATRSTDLNVTPAALVSHTMIRIQGDQDGDVAVYHACSPNARLRVQWGGMLMTMLSAQAIQGVLEGFSVARQTLALIPRQIPAPAPKVADPFALPTVAIDWTRRPAYAVVPRQELSRDRSRQLRWLDLHMGPVTFQILDQAGCLGAVALLRTAHHAAIQVFLDGPDYAQDPTESDYTPPSSA